MASDTPGLLCPACGESSPPGEFCAVCGSRLKAPQEPRWPRLLSGTLGGLLAVYFGLVGATCAVTPFGFRSDWMYSFWPLWVGAGVVWWLLAWATGRWALRQLRQRSVTESTAWSAAGEGQAFGEEQQGWDD